MKFVIIHGAFGSPEGNWFPVLSEKLESLGQEVISPQFPIEDFEEITRLGPKTSPKHQSLANWLKVFEKEVLPEIKKEEKICMIGHSLGPVFILHAADKYDLKLDSAIFVIPFLELGKGDWQYDLVNRTFYKTDFDFVKLKKLIPVSYVIYSDADPYVSKRLPLQFAHLMHSSVIQVQNAGHLNSEVNLNEFPLVLELCKSRLDLSLYQKYLAHRKDLYAVDYSNPKSEEVIYIDPKEVFDEGVFHFRNLKKSGFCTLLTSSTFWDSQSKYMVEARKAANRVGNFIRVYIVESASDLGRIHLLEQLKLDLSSGVKIYFCHLGDIKKSIPEPDFGIWDDDYVCVVRFDKDRNCHEVQLSSRKKDIQEAHRWQEFILKKAVRIKNISKDITAFIQSHS